MAKRPIETAPLGTEVRQALLELLQSGEVRIVEEGDGYAIKLSPSKKASITETVSGTIKNKAVASGDSATDAQDDNKPLSYEQFHDALRKMGMVETSRQGDKRTYRRKEDLVFPDLSPKAEKNRLKQKFNIRIDPEIIKAIAERSASQGVTQQEWVERVFLDALSNDN